MKKLLVIAASLLVAAFATAAPIVTLHGSNVGIDSINVTFFADPNQNLGTPANTIFIEEVWTQPGAGALLISGLEGGVQYTVYKWIINNTGFTWTRLANELLDPVGNLNDAQDVLPYPGFVPLGFSTSNDDDGLSFCQGCSVPRSSNRFLTVEADEFTDVRDFLDYSNGEVPDGEVVTVLFGLRNLVNVAENEPFILLQRPNVSSREQVPEPGTWMLFGAGLAGVAALRKRLG